MTELCDRRTFLTRLGRAGLVAPALGVVACARERGAEVRDGGGRADAPMVLTRPLLAPMADGAVRIASPPAELPMAYVSVGLRQVFVDYAFRDRASFLLRAHISVSTGLWRIPLPGDPPRQPITPGDTIREFEELDIAAWRPTLDPTEGDFRILAGRPHAVRIDLSCVPLAATEEWISGGPWSVRQCDGLGDEACREDLVEIGVGVRRRIRGCEDEGTRARILAWAC